MSPPSPAPFAWDKFSLYELCAQNPPRDARLLRAIHADCAGRKKQTVRLGEPDHPLTLAEDFCGTAALSRAWCELSPRFRAVAADIDAPTLARARESAKGLRRLKLIHADVHKVRDKADLIAVLNFSICELHERRGLVKYFRHARSRLRKGGVLICDIYGGSDVFELGMIDQRIKPPQRLASGHPHPPHPPHPARRDKITYSWEQRSADPLTARVVNAMHFDVSCHRPRPSAAGALGVRQPRHTDRSKPRSVAHEVFLNAFVYDWRLWSVPELRDAMLEAGFGSTCVYPRTAGATDSRGNLYTQPITDPDEVGDSFNVFVAGNA